MNPAPGKLGIEFQAGSAADTPAADFLVIGYGNTVRRDDGVGVRVAEAVAALGLPGVRVSACHQLVPELAEPISQAAVVVFVDASAEAAGEARLHPVKPGDASRALAHAASPAAMLALAKQMFGRAPAAWSLAIPVDDFGLGEGLSPRAEAGMHTAITLIESLFSRCGKPLPAAAPLPVP